MVILKRRDIYWLFALTALLFLTSCTFKEAPSTETVNGVTISVEGTTIELKSEGLSESLVQQVEALADVLEVEKYLFISASPYPVIGIEPGAPLRLDSTTAKIRVGRSFEAADDRVAIPGRRVNSGEYIQSTMPGMFHSFSVGQSFVLRGERIRVVGVYEAPEKGLEERVFLPLKTAQRLFNAGGRLTQIVVEVDSTETAERLIPEIKRLLQGD